MNTNSYLLAYLFVFLISFIGLLQGETGFYLLDAFLYMIFFMTSYTCAFIIKIHDDKTFKYHVFIIILLSSIYFIKISYYHSLINLAFYLWLLIKKRKVMYEPQKSVFFNFYNNSSKSELGALLIFLAYLLSYAYFCNVK